jgi:hypothetical protein
VTVVLVLDNVTVLVPLATLHGRTTDDIVAWVHVLRAHLELIRRVEPSANDVRDDAGADAADAPGRVD